AAGDRHHFRAGRATSARADRVACAPAAVARIRRDKRQGKAILPGMNFRDLSEPQILALAISAEEEDGRIYADFAEALRGEFPATAELFDAMAEEESGHRHRLIDLYRAKFGAHIPLIRREDV